MEDQNIIRERSREIETATKTFPVELPKSEPPEPKNELGQFKQEVNDSMAALVDLILQKDAETLEAKVLDAIQQLADRIESLENRIAVRNSCCQPYERI